MSTADDACCPPDGGGVVAPTRAAAGSGSRRGPGAGPPCPTCGCPGPPVDTLTVKALLAVPLTELRDVAYRFCPAQGCPAVYYSADGAQTFAETALREPVHQKHPDAAEVPVCYCFRHTPGSIRAELLATGRSTVVERVTAGVRAGRCACEVRNPQGACCLGNVRAVAARSVRDSREAVVTP